MVKKHTQHYLLLGGLLGLTMLLGANGQQFMATLYADLLPELDVSQQQQQLRETAQQIEAAASQAGATRQSAPDVQKEREAGLEGMELATETIGQIMQQKRAVRLEWAYNRDLAQAMKDEYDIDASSDEALAAAEQIHRDAVVQVARGVLRQASLRQDQPLFFQLVTAGFNDYIQREQTYRALAKTHADILAKIDDVRTVPTAIAVVKAKHEALQQAYHAAQQDFDIATEQVALSDAKLQEIKRIVAAVESQIQKMQIKMKEYDEQIRLRIEKELVAKGLKAPREGGYRAPTFIWPVVGTVTAGYYEPSYQRYFGVPHKAVDIRAAQGTSVRSSARGIVYHVQHGGAYGYSYILIGHQGGYATLYGHMYDIYVAAGDEVSQGQIIGLSGGQPGTRGAGPMTTGAHLHFEAIKDGAHINPLEILP